MRQSLTFEYILSNDILRSKIGVVVKKLLKFSESLGFRVRDAPIAIPESKILIIDTVS